MTVYVSMPLTGPASRDGQDAADGARLALEQADGRAGDLEVTAKFLDGANPVHRWDPPAVGRNARRAAQDSSTAAYIGELDSQATRTSMPITNDAGIVQVSPSAGGIDLTAPAEGYPDSPDLYRPSGSATFARVVPADSEAARATAEWAGELGLTRVLAASDGSAFGGLMLEQFSTDAAEVGIEVNEVSENQLSGVLDPRYRAAEASGAGAEAAGSLAVGADLFWASGLLASRSLPKGSFGADFQERFQRTPGPYAAYGYEAMRVVLDAIGDADTEEGFRASVVDGVLGSEHPDSILGSYSVTDEGDTTLCAVQRYEMPAGGRSRAGRAVCPRG